MPRANNNNGSKPLTKKRRNGYAGDKDDRTAFIMTRGGASLADLAFAFGKTEPTINTWMRKHMTFLSAIKRGRDIHDTGTVENAVLKRAQGYEYKETTEERVANDWHEDTGKPIGYAMALTKEITKHQPPDTAAGIFWLTNRANLCPVCNGTGYMTIEDSVEMECTECDGTGKRWRRIREVDFAESTSKKDAPNNAKGTTINIIGNDVAAETLRVLSATGAIGQLLPQQRSVSEDDTGESGSS